MFYMATIFSSNCIQRFLSFPHSVNHFLRYTPYCLRYSPFELSQIIDRSIEHPILNIFPDKKPSGVRSGDLAGQFSGRTFLSSFLQKSLVKGEERHDSCVLEHRLAGILRFQRSFQIVFSHKCLTIHNILLFSLFHCQSNIGLTYLQSEWHTKLLFFRYSFHYPVSLLDFCSPNACILSVRNRLYMKDTLIRKNNTA